MNTPAFDQLLDAVGACRRLLVLTGAGVSTASGIPDYRGPDGAWKQRQPVRYQEFIASGRARQRYWARSFAGWPLIDAARPNATHHALFKLQQGGCVHTLITQNVDGLHQRSGSQAIDLHGNLAAVSCLACAARSPRQALQIRLQHMNAGWLAAADRSQRLAAPDGDAELEDGVYDQFRVADCQNCGGLLKPDVVFFGEAVPAERVARCWAALDQADGLLVVGSSLMVFSGFRFARAAQAAGKPLFIINQGRTRADDLASFKLEAAADVALPALARRLLRVGTDRDRRLRVAR